MSAEAVKAFIEALKADETLQEKLKAAAVLENVDIAIVAIGKEAGFDFTPEEWLDEQLSAVVGGAWALYASGNSALGSNIIKNSDWIS
jgi:predicted ribosomally synthesized peptide with nif11-like leader